MKTPEQVAQDVRRRLANTWHTVTATQSGPSQSSQAGSWPHAFPLGFVPKTDLETNFDRHQQLALAWRDWSARNGVGVEDASRVVHGTVQRIPTHVIVPDIDVAARLSGPDWITRIGRARTRAARLRGEFPIVLDLARIIREIDQYSAVDFELLIAAAHWFADNSAVGLTPRQVPIPGLHAKWLNSHHRPVADLAGLADLGLLPPHPPRVHFTYLDPNHRRSGQRWHDSATVGDHMAPAYRPRVAVISENKDTALHFPELADAVSVEGVGFGGATITAIDWIRDCPNLFYWGDIDAAGFEILNGFRDAGISARSLLMDLPTYETYERFGTATDVKGNLIPAGRRRPLPHLTPTERLLYEHLVDPAWTRRRRVEQEKIPLDVARQAVTAHLTRNYQ